jgi:hypothetical protein
MTAAKSNKERTFSVHKHRSVVQEALVPEDLRKHSKAAGERQTDTCNPVPTTLHGLATDLVHAIHGNAALALNDTRQALS